MAIEVHSDVVVVRETGWGRFFGAAFLSVWLAFWVVGEVVAVAALGRGAWQLATGEVGPLVAGVVLPHLGIGLFLGVWLVFWTIGGVAAASELGRRVRGRDEFRQVPEGLLVESQGAWRTRKVVTPSELASLRLARRQGALVVNREGRELVLTNVGSVADRQALLATLEQRLHLARNRPRLAQLPAEWRLEAADGIWRLFRSPQTRRQQAHVTAVIAAIIDLPVIWSGVSMALGVEPLTGGLLTALGLGVVAGGLVTFGAVWLRFGAEEWCFGRMGLERRRTLFGRTRVAQWPRGPLVLETTTDSDNDDWHALRVGLEGQRPTLVSAINDPAPAESLGRAIAEATGWDLRDGLKVG